jgi:SAM-dependent methyltransferase
MTSASELSCKICKNKTNNQIIKVREMYFGTRDEFEYLECASCRCLQLLNPPKDFSKNYPKNYFTYQQKFESKLKSLLNRFRDKSAMNQKSFLGDILLKILGEPTYIKRLKNIDIGFDNKILDVGCGKGILLHKMKESGFNNILGIDPFIDETISYKNGLQILKGNYLNLNGKFDLIMFNHSFEHMENPLEVLNHSNQLLNHNKYLLVRIPVADSFAFGKYRENWCSLDAPRHLYLHTKKSIEQLADLTDFKIIRIDYDSRNWQFWGSEQYSKDISLLAENSYYVNPLKSIFSKNDIDYFEEQTNILNEKGEGDQAEFYLQKKN